MSIDDDDEVREAVDPRDLARFDAETIACPDCGMQIHSESYRCPHCNSLLTGDEGTEARKRPLWFRITAWICILLFTWWMILIVAYWLVHWWRT